MSEDDCPYCHLDRYAILCSKEGCYARELSCLKCQVTWHICEARGFKLKIYSGRNYRSCCSACEYHHNNPPSDVDKPSVDIEDDPYFQTLPVNEPPTESDQLPESPELALTEPDTAPDDT